MRNWWIVPITCGALVPAVALAQTDGGDGSGAPEQVSGPEGSGDGAPATTTTQIGGVEVPDLPSEPIATPTPEETLPVQTTGTTRTFEDYANANPPPGDTDSSTPQWQGLTESELLEETETYPYVEWHGYYRFRTDAFWNLDLDTQGTSPILPPIDALVYDNPETEDELPGSIPSEIGSEDAVADVGTSLSEYYDTDAEFIGGANMRARLRPIFQLSDTTRFHLEMNVLDNIVLGSTPDGFDESDSRRVRTDLPLMGFTGTQEPANWFNSGRDSVTVNQAYGEVNAFFGTIRLGRMASHWGLGILANGGGHYSTLREPRYSFRGTEMAGHLCMDCDYGDYVDRAAFVTNFFDTYIVLGWDYNFSGPTTLDTVDYFGQPRDLGNADDVHSFIVSLFRRPIKEEEIAERNRELKELRRPTLDWGAYFVYRTQRISGETWEATQSGILDEQYFPRGARAMIPDLWLRFQYEPAFRQRLRLEFEGVGIFGSIDNVRDGVDLDGRDIRQFAGALECDYVNFALATGFNAGFASGRTPGDESTSGFGVIDRNIPASDEKEITAYKFDRNYFVDMIMFRELIGTITNAIYVNPFVQYDLFTHTDDSLGLRLDLIYGQAMNPDTTPSGEGWYGVEADLSAYYREPRYGADVSFGYFLPGTAWHARTGNVRLQNARDAYGSVVGDNFSEDVDASPATSLQGHFYWAF